MAVGPAIGVAAVVALVLAIDPANFGRSIERFNPVLLAPIIAVSVGYFVVQGIRWHFLLVDVGVRMRMRDVVLLTLAGQSTALLPLGELTRSVFVTQVSHAEFGAVVAAETVQELLYTITLILFAVPGLLIFPNAIAGIIVILAGIGFVMVAMSWCRVYRYLRWVVACTPLLRRALHQVDELHNDLVVLLRKPGTLGWMWLSALQAAAMITMLWLVAAAIAPGALDWKAAALVFAVSNVAGLLSLIPGGLGAYEGSVIGLLMGLGVAPGAAAAVAIVQRLASQGIATGVGFAAYAVARRKLGVSSLGAVTIRGAPQRAPVAAEDARDVVGVSAAGG
ncbi:MAG TPA: lysylphosphatidylglycerol synthase transmembrane domain-containing protein [Dehalococcoidia bacterium]|nr:lysylphosphatidylglycerol synthase transmembrane domain-containing protein [Dehalococcoidia bacterium]